MKTFDEDMRQFLHRYEEQEQIEHDAEPKRKYWLLIDKGGWSIIEIRAYSAKDSSRMLVRLCEMNIITGKSFCIWEVEQTLFI